MWSVHNSPEVTFAASDDVCTGADAGEQRRLQAGTLAYTVAPDPALLPALLDKTRDGSWLDEVIVTESARALTATDY